MSRPGIAGAALGLWVVSLALVGAQCGPPTTKYFVSPDTTAVVGAMDVCDEDVVRDKAGKVRATAMGSLPEAVELAGYHRLPAGEGLLLFDTWADLGSLVAGPRDVVLWDGAGHSLLFDGAAAGVPDGARIDAVSANNDTGDLVLSFDVAVALSGGVDADDEDLVLWDGSAWSLLFDGSARGLDASLDVDAAHYVPGSGDVLVSLDSGGSVAGVDFSDADVLLWQAASGAWSIAYAGDQRHAGWAAADLVALHRD